MRAVLLLALSLSAAAQTITQPQVPLTGTTGPGGIFPFRNSGTLNFTADANQTMIYPQTSAAFIKLTSSVSLTAMRTLVAPLGIGFSYTFFNDTTGAQIINVCGATGSCAAVPNDGQPHTVSSDGANYYTATTSVTAVSVGAANGLIGSSSGGTTPVLTIGPDSSHLIPTNTGSAATYLNGAGTYTIPPGLPVFTGPATFTPVSTTSSTGCATSSCSNLRGTFQLSVNSSTSGTLGSVSWAATPSAYVCQVTQNGGTPGFIGLTHSVATTTGFTISTTTVGLAGSFGGYFDYACQP